MWVELEARPPAGKSGGRGPTGRFADGCQMGWAATAQIRSEKIVSEDGGSGLDLKTIRRSGWWAQFD
jgi:hypothetical protein